MKTSNSISFSKEGQDRLAKVLLKKNGFFLDIGCGEPQRTNNTFLLEKYGWKGLLIDKNIKYIESCNYTRKNPAFNLDCDVISHEDWSRFLSSNNTPELIDYISVDVNYSNINFMNNFPFDKYEFKLMTFETDCYKHGNIIKNTAINKLSKYEFYDILLENATLERNGRIWEDWWINNKYIKCKQFYNSNMYWLDFINNLESKFYKRL